MEATIIKEGGLTKKGSGRRVGGTGRKKIPIRKIENKKALMVAFSKRRKGLFKKAEELSILCVVDVALVAFSPAGKPFVFSNKSSANPLIDHYLSQHVSSSSASVVDDNADDPLETSEFMDPSSEFPHPSSSPANAAVIEPFVSSSKNNLEAFLFEEMIDIEEMRLELEEMWSLEKRLEDHQNFLESICMPSSFSTSCS